MYITLLPTTGTSHRAIQNIEGISNLAINNKYKTYPNSIRKAVQRKKFDLF
ncbi:hypothetical protein LL1119B1_19760 [Lactococcus lactis]|nr:hypothetical protein LL1119B1_19760 [Lactococcus lactis]